MQNITTISALETLYGQPSTAAIRKVSPQLTSLYRRWIMASRFCVLTSVGADGTDGSPRGEDGPVVLELNPQTLAMPDWRGNNRLDSLRNIINDGRVSLMFLVPGSTTLVRVNGHAVLTVDDELRARFERQNRLPATVIVITLKEVYAQCARAALRAGLWQRDDSDAVPSMGDIVAEMTNGDEGATQFDAKYANLKTDALW